MINNELHFIQIKKKDKLFNNFKATKYDSFLKLKNNNFV